MNGHNFFNAKLTIIYILQYRITKKFVEKSATTNSRGLTVKHIPSGEVCTL